jgi:hypothetical protein
MSELRVTMLVSDPRRSYDARLIRDLFGRVAPYCGVGIHALESIEQLEEGSPRFAHGVTAALSSNIVLFFGARDTRTNALLIAFRERSGYTTRGKVTPDGFGAFVVAEDFARRYPVTTQAVVRAYVKAAQWGREPANRNAALDIWGLAGTPHNTLVESFQGVDLRRQLDPRLDAFYLATLKSEVAFAQANKLIRAPVDINAWLDRSYIAAAVRDLRLTAYWPSRTFPHTA